MKIKTSLFFLIFCCTLRHLSSQNNHLDSLLKVVKVKQIDTSLVKLLNNSAKDLFKNNECDSALFVLNSNITYIKKSKVSVKDEETALKRAEVDALLICGSIYYSSNDISNALKYANMALSMSHQINFHTGIYRSNMLIGSVYQSQGNYPEALKNYYTALKICETNYVGKQLKADVYNCIANVLYNQNNYNDALNNYFLALNIRNELKDDVGAATVCINIGSIHLKMLDYSNALKNYFVALNIMEKLDDKYNISLIYNNVAVVYEKQGKFEEALDKLFYCLKIKEEIGDNQNLASCYINIGSNYNALKRPIEAKKWLEKALVAAKATNNLEDLMASFENLAESESALENYKDAFKYYKSFVKYRDSLINEENTKLIVKQQMQYEFDKKQTADSLKMAEEKKVTVLKLKQEKTQRYFLYAGLLLVFAFAAFMFNRFKITKKQKRMIELQKQEVEKQKQLADEKQKEILDSIHYAKRIQQALLPNNTYIKRYLGQQ